MNREKIQELKHKSRVRLRYDHEAVGFIDALGLEQSGVKFDDGKYRFVSNPTLELLEKP